MSNAIKIPTPGKKSPIQNRKLTTENIVLMARDLVLVTLPHKDPGNIPRWTRRNGNITLAVQPGYKDDPKDPRKSICIGYPYGSITRLILYWIVTEARRTGDPRLELGKSLAEFMRKLGLKPDGSTGKRSSANSVHRQLERLIYARITFEQDTKSDTRKGRKWLEMPVAQGGLLWWDAKDTEQKALWGSFVVLNDNFFRVILTHPVPVRMITLLALKKSPLGLDLYAWATLESYKAQHHRKGRFVAWKLLHEQFGNELGTVKNFAAKAKRELRKIMLNCPGIKLAFDRGGVQVLAGSLPDVSIKTAHEVLNPPPYFLRASGAPSAKAIAHVMKMETSEGALTLATKFHEAVSHGVVENTDEAFISFAKQYLM
jgi:hypothetical protein